MGRRELLGSRSDKVDVRALLENETRGLDGVAEALDAGHAASLHAAAVHEEGVELDAAFRGEEAAAPGVEGGVVFKNADSGFHCIEGGAAKGKDLVAGLQGFANAGFVSFSGIGRNGPGATVDDEDGIVGRGRRHRFMVAQKNSCQ